MIAEEDEATRHSTKGSRGHQGYAVVENDQGEISASQCEHADIDGRFATESLGEIVFRGMARPQLAYRVLVCQHIQVVHKVAPR